MKKLLLCLLALMLLALPVLAEEGGDPPLAPDLYLKGNPSTGYEWLYKVDDPTVLTVTDNGFEPSSEGEGLVGAGGDYTFRLDGLTSGMTDVTFVYARSWETDEAPLCTLVYSVLVEDNLDAKIFNCQVDPGL